jgi:hypothetical protein
MEGSRDRDDRRPARAAAFAGFDVAAIMGALYGDGIIGT